MMATSGICLVQGHCILFKLEIKVKKMEMVLNMVRMSICLQIVGQIRTVLDTKLMKHGTHVFDAYFSFKVIHTLLISYVQNKTEIVVGC
jgi:hypothetical protein